MKFLRDLCKLTDCSVIGNQNREIDGIAYHSKAVNKNYMFVAIDGFFCSGKSYINEAISRGASVIVCKDRSLINRLSNAYPHITFIISNDCRRFLATAANWFYDYPSNSIKLIGITGTDGKTTTSYIIKSILEAAGKSTGLIGTIKYYDGERYLRASHTTPESLDLVRFLHNLRTKNIQYCICEVSSHALALNRVHGLDFHVAVFTNISQDHLDFHRTLSAYKKAKLKLFQMVASNGYAAVNLNDKFSQIIVKNTDATVIGYGVNLFNIPDQVKTIVAGKILSKTIKGTNVLVKITNRESDNEIELDVILPMIGEHNVFNMLGAIAAAYALKIPYEIIPQGISACSLVTGRLQKITANNKVNIYIDYAHTPRALETVIKSLREITKGRIIVVFGCGGNRDAQKRPLMGKISTELADFAVITSDNPRNENPLDIIKNITTGIKKDNYKIIVNRSQAIKEAILMAQKDDAVLIAGKGHEKYQIIGDRKIPYSDFAVVKQTLKILKET
ncbi:MAG: UDP-N-acetylmuramoyl-L-alanyl-D-glutamate--2,6-diaminopimelate ligase [candidate division WOR-3 bacterium]